MEAGLEGVTYYDPPNMTFPFGTYAVVVEIDRGTGQWKPLKVVAVDDCGVRINPMIVEGQIMGGLTEGYAIAAMQLIDLRRGRQLHRLELHGLPDPDRVGDAGVRARRDGRRRRRTIRSGRRASASRATVGSPAAYVNAVIDALCARGREEHRHAAHARQGVGRDARGGDRRVTDPSPRLDRGSVLVEAGRLADEGRPFVARDCRARVRRPASARIGDRGLVTADGKLVGWVGGACSEPAVVREALRALAEGTTRLLRICPPGGSEGGEGVVVAESSCASEGTVEVLIEPQLPAAAPRRGRARAPPP